MDTTLFTRPQNNGPLKNACKRYTPLDFIFCASAPPKKWTSAIGDLNAFHPIYTENSIFMAQKTTKRCNPLSKIRFTVLTQYISCVIIIAS